MNEATFPTNQNALTVLMEEHDKIMLAFLLENKVDFSHLRSIANDFDEINSESTDEDLWQSTCEYLRNLSGQS